MDRRAPSSVARLRSSLAALVATSAVAFAPSAHAQPASSGVRDTEVQEIEQLRHDSLATRRVLADSVLVGGLVSIAGGIALMVPSGDDQAWRFAGLNTTVFGAVNTGVALVALHGIGREESRWESETARAARRTPEGLTRARIHAAEDERRESVSHAINFGLGVAYLGVAGSTILASQLGVDHPNRWLGSGVAIAFQALFLIGVDYVGLTRSSRYHRALVESFTPSIAIVPGANGTDARFGLGGTF